MEIMPGDQLLTALRDLAGIGGWGSSTSASAAALTRLPSRLSRDLRISPRRRGSSYAECAAPSAYRRLPHRSLHITDPFRIAGPPPLTDCLKG